MKKRIVSLILCGLMVFSAAGCSGGGENKAGKDDVSMSRRMRHIKMRSKSLKRKMKAFGLNLRRSHMMSLNQKYRPL